MATVMRMPRNGIEPLASSATSASPPEIRVPGSPLQSIRDHQLHDPSLNRGAIEFEMSDTLRDRSCSRRQLARPASGSRLLMGAYAPADRFDIRRDARGR